MPETTAKEASLATERVAQHVRDAKLGDGGIEISFGVAGITDADPETLLEDAEAELLRAKDRLYRPGGDR